MRKPTVKQNPTILRLALSLFATDERLRARLDTSAEGKSSTDVIEKAWNLAEEGVEPEASIRAEAERKARAAINFDRGVIAPAMKTATGTPLKETAMFARGKTESPLTRVRTKPSGDGAIFTVVYPDEVVQVLDWNAGPPDCTTDAGWARIRTPYYRNHREGFVIKDFLELLTGLQ